MQNKIYQAAPTLAGMALLALSAQAVAIPVIGASGGAFASLSSCDNSGSSQTCRIANTSNGSSTQVQWGSQSIFSDFSNPSRLTSVDVNINTNTDTGGLGVVIGRLDWYNSATIATADLNAFAVSWTLSLAFSAPNGPDPYGSELFNLAISNPLNPAGDLIQGLGLADLNGLANSINLAGVGIGNLRYSVIDGAGAGTSYFNNNVWYNAENNTSSLYILADFRGTRTSVPEPGPLALFGLGLLGMAWASRSRRIRKLTGR